MIKLAIVEDRRDLLESMITYFSKDKEVFSEIHGFNSMEAALASAISLDKYIFLLDINLPGISGIEGIPLLKKKYDAVDILMISVLSDSENIFNSICAGASGYIDKETSLPKIKEALIQISEGGSPITPAIARKVFDYFQPSRKVAEPLTAREEEVVRGIVDGLSYKLIADRMRLSINTVRKYIRQIYSKLEINSKGELISRFHQNYISKK